MNKQEWFEYAEQHKEKLESLIRNYHPVSPGEKKELPITAVNAERACEFVRKQIQQNSTYIKSPIETFRNALEQKNMREINTMLNEAWFGVPESTDCWQLEGFKEAVILMEDLPE